MKKIIFITLLALFLENCQVTYNLVTGEIAGMDTLSVKNPISATLDTSCEFNSVMSDTLIDYLPINDPIDIPYDTTTIVNETSNIESTCEFYCDGINGYWSGCYCSIRTDYNDSTINIVVSSNRVISDTIINGRKELFINMKIDDIHP